MTEPGPDKPPASIPEAGIVRWFDAKKRIGVIVRPDGATIFIPPYGLAAGQQALGGGQAVEFIVKANAKGTYAAEVRAVGEVVPPPDDPVGEIALALGESVPQAIVQIRRIVRLLGVEAARGYLAEAQRIEEAGGMLLPDGSRRRTPGGVFFAIVKDALPEEQRAVIFPPLQVRKPPKKPAAPAEPPPPPPPPFAWADRVALVTALAPQSGKASTVKVTIIGRPSRVEEQPQVTLLTLSHAGPMPPVPKGVPVPDPVPTTTYSIYVGKKQWRAVAEAMQDPEDVLIIEGTQVLDAATGTIAVFATKTTTKLIQRAARAAKPAEGGAA